ncbi:MAG: hypothetical protein A3F67_07895 [Verrucomicrobia bacterium RIFCSPHIGHO2_12_FULL_41_10]|nr:MAG: hypothetical protein A3F67_07895 [Verrucomicrobia bacterium RIFCSPHIGHO2_12_FULL_41_10]HLB34781.1 3-dehydroquinate synthase family protein [Chthoniobacterales bacterium]
MHRVTVSLASHSYEILIGENLLDSVGCQASAVIVPGRCAIITDTHVEELYAERVIDSLRKAQFQPILIIIPPGENSKSLEQVDLITSRMIESGLDRFSSVFSLGGGVIGDLAGFVAAIFYRGVPLVHIPTTLLAQVDSSIGGKSAVNSKLGKNLLGAFHQPHLVLSDICTLKTLTKQIFREGFSEIIKHGIISDTTLLPLVLQVNEEKHSLESLSTLIARNVTLKASIVMEDERDLSGRRALLNFGHTLGHAIEAASFQKIGQSHNLLQKEFFQWQKNLENKNITVRGGLSSDSEKGNCQLRTTNNELTIRPAGRIVSHGEAVALGMVAALNLSVRFAGLDPQERATTIEIIKACGLPTTLPKEFSLENIYTTLLKDKKFERGNVKFVLTSKIGSAFLNDGLTLDNLFQALQELQKK